MAGQSGASLQTDKDILEALKRLIRIGTVQSFDAKTRKGRVKFMDNNGMNSSELKFVARPRHIAPNKEPPDQKDDKVKIACDHCPHIHEAYVMDWNPETGAWVLCIMRPDGSGDGYVIGEV